MVGKYTDPKLLTSSKTNKAMLCQMGIKAPL